MNNTVSVRLAGSTSKNVRSINEASFASWVMFVLYSLYGSVFDSDTRPFVLFSEMSIPKLAHVTRGWFDYPEKKRYRFKDK